MADLQPNPDYYLPPRPKMPTYAPAELRAGEISEMPPWYRRPIEATADSVRAFGRMFGYDDFDKRTADTFHLMTLAGLAKAPAAAAARAGVDANIAAVLSRYAPREMKVLAKQLKLQTGRPKKSTIFALSMNRGAPTTVTAPASGSTMVSSTALYGPIWTRQ